MFAIEASNLRKSFGKTKAIDGLSLRVRKGSIHAILGPNGSGKTTFIRVCTTLLKPDRGSVLISGHDAVLEAKTVRNMISITGQSTSIDEEMTGSENLYLFARLLGYSRSDARLRVKDLLMFFGLETSGNILVKRYSGGMRRRLDLAASIVRVPEILFLDEPTNGLDPRSRSILWSVIRKLIELNTTVLLTTQHLEEANQLADRITVIDLGRVISEGTIDELKSSLGTLNLHFNINDASLNLDSLLDGSDYYLRRESEEGKEISVPVRDHDHAIELLCKLRGEKITSFNMAGPSLDEVFLALTGNKTMAEENTEASGNMAEDDGSFLHGIDRILKTPPVNHSGMLTHKLMFGWRNLLKIKHVPEQFVDVLITPVMFTFLFTYLFGGAVAGSPGEYLQFLIPGIMVQTLAFNTAYSGINIHTDITKGIFDRFRTMPVWPPSPLAGIFIGDFLKYLISGIIVLLFGYILGFRAEAGLFGYVVSFLVMIAFAMSISWIFIIMGLTMRSTSAVMSIGWLLLTPIVFMSNIYVDPVTMPQWMQTFISWNPLSWQVDAVRGLLLGEPSMQDIVFALGGSLIIGLVLSPVAILLYKKER
jgi:ABC-2 type transport system ATP-binding protein